MDEVGSQAPQSISRELSFAPVRIENSHPQIGLYGRQEPLEQDQAICTHTEMAVTHPLCQPGQIPFLWLLTSYHNEIVAESLKF